MARFRAMADDELHNLAEVVRQVQIERAIAPATSTRSIAAAFEVGFGRDGLGVLAVDRGQPRRVPGRDRVQVEDEPPLPLRQRRRRVGVGLGAAAARGQAFHTRRRCGRSGFRAIALVRARRRHRASTSSAGKARSGRPRGRPRRVDRGPRRASWSRSASATSRPRTCADSVGASAVRRARRGGARRDRSGEGRQRCGDGVVGLDGRSGEGAGGRRAPSRSPGSSVRPSRARCRRPRPRCRPRSPTGPRTRRSAA